MDINVKFPHKFLTKTSPQSESRGLKYPLFYPWVELGQFDNGCDWSALRHSCHSYVINKHHFSAPVLLYIR